jgi:hypothetical protein
MFRDLSPSLWFFGLAAFTVLVLLLRGALNSEARLQRRRRKNYGRTVSRAKGPTVKLAVRANG